jgi:hypothetical protein
MELPTKPGKVSFYSLFKLLNRVWSPGLGMEPMKVVATCDVEGVNGLRRIHPENLIAPWRFAMHDIPLS